LYNSHKTVVVVVIYVPAFRWLTAALVAISAAKFDWNADCREPAVVTTDGVEPVPEPAAASRTEDEDGLVGGCG